MAEKSSLPGFSQVEAPVTARATRAVHTFIVPEKLKAKTGDGVDSIGLVKLSADEEIQASRLGRANDSTMLELLKIALVAVNGKKVSTGDGTSDASINRMDPKTRSIVVAAFGSIHNPEREEVEDFLRSVTLSVT